MLTHNNGLMQRINIFLPIAVMVICAGCSADLTNPSATPDFVTAVLPSTLTPVSTSTVNPSASALSEIVGPTIVPIEGTTTTQVNVREGPTTASKSIGMVNIFTKIQVTGRDASGSWYQIVYAVSETGNGWVRADYVQVNAIYEIPVIGSVAGTGSAVNGRVTQKINVRNGPGIEYDSLGVLNPNDVVSITGKDSSGAWIQIEFASSPDGTGWAASEYLEVNNTDSLPIIGEAGPLKETPTSSASTTTAVLLPATEDGDSMQAPLAVTIFSSTNARALQVKGNVSAPEGDSKDWIQFSAAGNAVVVGIICSSNALQVELWSTEALVNTFSLPCGDKEILNITPNTWYYLSLSEPIANEPQYTDYTLNLETLR
jgi:uncharacterized protein YraI